MAQGKIRACVRKKQCDARSEGLHTVKSNGGKHKTEGRDKRANKACERQGRECDEMRGEM